MELSADTWHWPRSRLARTLWVRDPCERQAGTQGWRRWYNKKSNLFSPAETQYKARVWCRAVGKQTLASDEGSPSETRLLHRTLHPIGRLGSLNLRVELDSRPKLHVQQLDHLVHRDQSKGLPVNVRVKKSSTEAVIPACGGDKRLHLTQVGWTPSGRGRGSLPAG